MEILCITSSLLLGIFLGAQICEGVLFVPFWKSLSPEDFFELHKTYGEKIYQFFAPLTIAATTVPILTAVYIFINDPKNLLFALLMAVFTLLFFSTYFLYFKKANRGFSEASISHEQLPQELQKWGNWHWVRIGFESVAFLCSLIILNAN